MLQLSLRQGWRLCALPIALISVLAVPAGAQAALPRSNGWGSIDAVPTARTFALQQETPRTQKRPSSESAGSTAFRRGRVDLLQPQ